MDSGLSKSDGSISGKAEETEKEIIRNADPETIDILPSSLPSSSIVATVPEPKEEEKDPWMTTQSQVIQTLDPPILGAPCEKEKLAEMLPLHSQHPLREEDNANKNRLWKAFLKLDERRLEL